MDPDQHLQNVHDVRPNQYPNCVQWLSKIYTIMTQSVLNAMIALKQKNLDMNSIQEMFHVYLNKFQIAVTHLFFVIFAIFDFHRLV